MTDRRTVRRLDEIPAESGAGPGVQVRRLKRVEDVELKVIDVAPGQATPFHQHPHSHEGVVIAGRGALLRNDGTQRLSSGDAFSVDPNEAHAMQSHGTEPLRMLCMDCFND